MVVGESVIIDMQESNVAMLSDWWNFSDDSCRGQSATQSSSMSLNVSFDPPLDDGNCGNLWQQSGSVTTTYQANSPTNGRAHVTGAFVATAGLAWPAGSEWYAFRMVIDKRNTVAPQTACAGCLDGACFTFTSAEIHQPVGTPGGTQALFDPAGRGQWASYRGGGVLSCVPCDRCDPTHRSTWGQVKSLYR